MKCPKCGGTGEMQICEMGFIGKDECDECHGKGYLTNDEWRKTCSTEEFAEWIFQIFGEGVTFGETHGKTKLFPNDDIIHEGLVLEWLKQPHKQKGD